MSTNLNKETGWSLGMPAPVQVTNQNENHCQSGMKDGRFTSQAPVHPPPPPKSQHQHKTAPVAQRRSRWGSPMSKSSRPTKRSSTFTNRTLLHNRTTPQKHWPATKTFPPLPPPTALQLQLGAPRIVDSMEESGTISIDAPHHPGEDLLFVASSEGAKPSIPTTLQASTGRLVEGSENCEPVFPRAQREDQSSHSAQLKPSEEVLSYHSVSAQVEDDDARPNITQCMKFDSDLKMANGESSKRSSPSDDPYTMSLSGADKMQSTQSCLVEDPSKSTTVNLDNAENSTTDPQNDKATLVRLAQLKLRHARLQLVTAITRQQTLTVSPTLPPITALSQPLLVHNILSYDKSLVQLLPERELTKGVCDVVIPDHSDSDDDDDDEVFPDDLHQRSKALRKNLLLLKKKKLELTLRMHQQASASRPATEEVIEPRVFDKEALKKRQEELQQKMEAAYWKRLVIQQRNLLAAERKEVRQHEEKILSCEEEIQLKMEAILECEQRIHESKVREKCLDEMIGKTARGVLDARKRRLELQISIQIQPKKSRPSNHDIIDLTSP